jgi:hypothetical protein
VAALAWLLKFLFSSGLQRDLERYKRELDVKQFERQARFFLIHQKRAEVIAELYARLARARARIGELVAIFQPGGQSLIEKKKLTAEVFNDANSYFQERRIFLQEEIAENVDLVFKAMWEALIEFDTAQRGSDEYKPDNTGLWIQSFKRIREELPPLMKKMEAQFRLEIDAIDSNGI